MGRSYILLVLIWKYMNILEKLSFFQADTAGLVKYRTGRYSRNGVYG